MTSLNISETEYNSYYKPYLDLLSGENLNNLIAQGEQTTQTFFQNIPSSKWDYQYAEGKWTPKDILMHIADTERVFAYRALYFSRFNDAELKGFDENVFAENALARNQSITSLLKNYSAVRKATLSLFKSFDENMLRRIGRANGSQMSVRAAGFIICGHEIHHINVIKERYLL